MNLICIDENTYAYFQQWNRNIMDKLMSAKPYFEKCAVIIKECPEYILYVTACVKNNIPKQKFSLKYNKTQIAKGLFHKSPEQSDCDLKIDYQIVERNIDSQQMLDDCLEAIEYMIDSYINANAFLWYGNYLDRDKREFSAIGKNDNQDKTIVFRPFKNQLYATSVGHHRSPEGVFQVRGHFRRYQTGQVVWIDGYMKGIDKDTKSK